MGQPQMMWQDDTGRVMSIHDHIHNRGCRVFPTAIMRRPSAPFRDDLKAGSSALATAEASQPFIPLLPAITRPRPRRARGRGK